MDFQEKIEKLPVNVKTFFTSNEVLSNMEQACFLYGIKDGDIEKIAQQIGMIFVGDEKLSNLQRIVMQNLGVPGNISFGIAYEINKRIFNKFPEYFKDSKTLLEEWGRMKSAPIMSEDEAWQKVLEVEPWIAELESEKKEESAAGQKKEEERRVAMVRIKLQEALKKFEKLGEQHLSGNAIKLKIFESPVRPSIKNWISDYYEKVDARKHDSIERGNYLFHSDNARRLTTGERQKVGTMLRALDEDGMVTVDQGRQEIVFSGEETPHPSPLPVATGRGGSGTRFSSGHRFPFEQKSLPVRQAGPQPPFTKGEDRTAPAPRPQPSVQMPTSPQPRIVRPEYDNFGFAEPRRQDSRPSNNVVDLRE